MTALKFWNGTAWISVPSATEVWTGPDAPVPRGDFSLWVDTDEPDPGLSGSNAWTSTDIGAAGASTANAWIVVPLPTAFSAQGDAGAFTRNADGSMTVRDAGVYSITASPITGGTAGTRKIACITKGLDPNAAGAPVLAWSECDNTAVPTVASANLAFTGYLPAGQVISVQAYSVEAQAGRLMRSFGIARVGTGPQGVPGPPGPSGDIIAIPSVILASLPIGNVAYTTVDVSANTPPGTKSVVVNVSIGGTRIAATFATNLVDFRRDAASAVIGSVGCSVAGTGSAPAGVQVLQSIIVPVTAARTFQYQKTDGLGASSGGSIVLYGYVL